MRSTLARLAASAAMFTMFGNGGYTYEPPPTHPIIGTLIRTVHTDAGTMKVYRNELECLLVLSGELMQAVDLGTCSR